MEKVELKEIRMFCFDCPKCNKTTYIEGCFDEIELRQMGLECDYCNEKLEVL